MMEVTKDIDAYRASTYYHKKKDSNDGKIHAGPIWDFNFAFGLVDYCEGYLPTGYMFSGIGVPEPILRGGKIWSIPLSLPMRSIVVGKS